MRRWLLITLLVQLPAFVAIDRYLVHDSLTSFACGAALALSHLLAIGDQRNP